jgi:type II secretory pathway pseudopilin PulG
MISIAFVAAIGLYLFSGSIRKREKQEMKRLRKTLYSL